MKPFKQCKYSAFISYAHADDEGRGGWISAFTSELERALRNRVGRSIGMPVPGMHLSGKNGPVSGRLSAELLERIADSFAMIIVVHDNYVHSDWCLHELAYFKTLFGDEGFLERLYVVALSEPAIQELTAKPAWTQQLPFDDQLWTPFFRDDARDLPVRIRLDNGQFSQRFEEQFERVLSDLIDKVKQDCRAGPRAAVATPVPQRVAAAPAGRLLFGVASPELAGRVQSLADGLAAGGVACAVLEADALNGDFHEFDEVGHLVLAFSDAGQPVKPFRFSPGGHLAAQRDAWLGKGRPAGQLLWLDLREVACPGPPGPGHAALVDAVAATALTPAALQARLRPPTPAAPDRAVSPPVERINIYIESNQNEVDLWDPLGEQIKRKWALLVQQYGAALVPPLFLHTRALSVNRIDSMSRLEDADGVVLLWGQKTDDSLRETINKVERLLPGDIPPGIVAYLMPPRADPRSRVEGNYWKVLRFADANSDGIDIVHDEADLLQGFLRKVLLFSARKRRLTVPAVPVA
jgi:TIR domain